MIGAAAALLAAVFSLAGIRGYLGEVRAGSPPRLASWAIWATAMSIGAAGAASAGQLPGATLTAVGAAGCYAILVSGWRHGSREFGPLDAVCAVLGTAGIALLAIATARPALIPVDAAVAVSVATDLMAYLPTFANAWRGSEPLRPFVWFTAAGAVALAGADLSVLAGVIYPAYEAAVNAAMIAVVLACPAGRGFRRTERAAPEPPPLTRL